MPKRASFIVAAILVAGGFALPSRVRPSAAAVPPPIELGAGATGVAPPNHRTVAAANAGATGVAPPDQPSVSAADIVPGSVGRSSIALEATYAAYLKISWASGLLWVDSTATIRNTSGGPIDRVELNTIATRLGDIDLQPVTVDGTTVPATISDQTIVVPLGGVLPAGGSAAVRVRYAARARTNLTGSNWMFTKANGILDLYRWLPWVSRRIAFDRPNHGDPFETPTSPSVKVRIATSQRLVLATSGDRTGVSLDGLVQDFEASDVRDFTVTAATDYRTQWRVLGTTTVLVWYRPGAPGAAMLDAAADAFVALRNRLGPYPRRYFKVVQSAGGYGMESPGLIWIPTGQASANLRYLAAHETAHQWFYGIVGNDQALEPFTDEAAADFVARNILGLKRASRCSTGRLDLSIYQYSATCYYERIYIQGGNLLDEARRRMGSTTFWAALRGYITSHRDALAPTSSLLYALDAATPLDLAHTLFEPRFPRLY